MEQPIKEERGYFLQRYRWSLVIIWVGLALIGLCFLPHLTKAFRIGGISDPHAESAQAHNIMTGSLGYGGSELFILYESTHLKAQDARFKEEVKKSLAGLRHFPPHTRIISPYDNARQISPDKHAAFAVVIVNESGEKVARMMNEFRRALVQPASLKMFVGGHPAYIEDVKKLSESNLFRAEMIALPLSIVTLILIFASLVTAMLPILCGAISVSITISILYLLGHHYELSVFVINIASMLGLGLTMDYSLLIINRFREELGQGRSSQEAVKTTLHTAGKAVFFSGLTVLVSFSALLFFPVNVLFSIGVGGCVVVIIAILCSLIFLPAVLCLLGPKVDAWTLSWIKHGVAFDAAQDSLLFKAAMHIMKRPICYLVPTILFLLMLGYPFLHVKLNRPDSTILPTWIESRELLDEFQKYFNVNEINPIYIVVKAQHGSMLTRENIGELYNYTRRLQNDPRVDHVGSIVTLKPHVTRQEYQYFYTSRSFAALKEKVLQDNTKGPYTVIRVISKYPVNDTHTFALVRKIREEPVGAHLTKMVGGDTASIIDTIKSVYSLFFKAIIIIAVLTYGVLLLLLRSLVLPLKALIMNFLSLIVSYGMLVYIFQEGHFATLLGFKAQGFTDLNLPILIFFSLFGISMDYEVFLLTRIKEFYERTGDNNLSVALGLERSARIITCAALIIAIVCCAFVTADIVFIKSFGLGTALAVAVDATVIRILLVPSTMRLLGKWNWYLPGWLDRLLPTIRLGL